MAPGINPTVSPTCQMRKLRPSTARPLLLAYCYLFPATCWAPDNTLMASTQPGQTWEPEAGGHLPSAPRVSPDSAWDATTESTHPASPQRGPSPAPTTRSARPTHEAVAHDAAQPLDRVAVSVGEVELRQLGVAEQGAQGSLGATRAQVGHGQAAGALASGRGAGQVSPAAAVGSAA